MTDTDQPHGIALGASAPGNENEAPAAPIDFHTGNSDFDKAVRALSAASFDNGVTAMRYAVAARLSDAGLRGAAQIALDTLAPESPVAKP